MRLALLALLLTGCTTVPHMHQHHCYQPCERRVVVRTAAPRTYGHVYRGPPRIQKRAP